jgi:GNAT superfamily N-acetyltransferase
MMSLALSKFHSVLSVVSEFCSLNAVQLSVIERKQEGDIFVDDVGNPQCVLVCHIGGFCFLSGDANNPLLNRGLSDLLLKKLPHQMEGFGPLIMADSEDWYKKLDQMLENRVQTIPRLSFDFYPNKFGPNLNCNNRIPPEFTIRRVNESLFERIGIEFKLAGFFKCWTSFQEFMANGLGFCLLFRDKIVCACLSYSACVSTGDVEITVVTAEEFRNRGLATLTCSAFIEHCISNNLKPNWGCRVNNLSSAALAQKLGFEKTGDYKIYWIKEVSK